MVTVSEQLARRRSPAEVGVEDPGQLIPVVRTTAVVRCNPLTKIAMALLLMIGALLSIDVVSAGVVLLYCLLGLPATGLDLTAALKRLWFLPAGALLAAWGTAILAEKTGAVVIDVGMDRDENGKLCVDQCNLACYMHGEYFAPGKKLGTFGYSVRKKTKRRPGPCEKKSQKK